MTGEQICQISTEELEKMDDAALLAYFAPILKITRPSEVVREADPAETVASLKAAPKVRRARTGTKAATTDSLMAELLALAKKQGIEI